MAKKTDNKNEKKKNRHSPLRILKNNLYMMKFAAKFTPEYIFWMIVEGIIWGYINSLTGVVFLKLLFDRLEQGEFGPTASIISFMAAFHLLTYVFHTWYWGWYNFNLRQKLQQKLHKALFEKARTLDLACYDDPEFYNDFVWAIQESDGRIVGILEDTGKLINRVISAATIIGVLLTIDFTIILTILAFVGISAVLNLWRQKIMLKASVEVMPKKRKTSYIQRVFSLPDFAKEIRLSHAYELLDDEYRENVAETKKIGIFYYKKLFVVNAIEVFLQIGLCDAGIMILLLYKLIIKGTILLGDFAAANSAVWQLYHQVNSLIEHLLKFPEHSLYTEKFRTFMEYVPKVVGGSRDVPEFSEIRFNNVSFAYTPEAEKSLQDIDMVIRKNEKIAIVGYNGAGKSTLIKLLLHLYDPTSGSISLNGVDLKEYDMEQYRKKIGVVFQDYQIFAATLAENVMASQYTEDMCDTVLRALDESTFSNKLAELENGIDTPLTREFSEKGINLSGGESQKVALARVFAKNYELLVMDEPSSALDPMAEYELNQTILKYAKNKTIIFISHRLSTTRMADRIFMFDSGRLIEQGSHDELMKTNGKYAEMFRMQAEKYRVGQSV